MPPPTCRPLALLLLFCRSSGSTSTEANPPSALSTASKPWPISFPTFSRCCASPGLTPVLLWVANQTCLCAGFLVERRQDVCNEHEPGRKSAPAAVAAHQFGVKLALLCLLMLVPPCSPRLLPRDSGRPLWCWGVGGCAWSDGQEESQQRHQHSRCCSHQSVRAERADDAALGANGAIMLLPPRAPKVGAA